MTKTPRKPIRRYTPIRFPVPPFFQRLIIFFENALNSKMPQYIDTLATKTPTAFKKDGFHPHPSQLPDDLKTTNIAAKNPSTGMINATLDKLEGITKIRSHYGSRTCSVVSSP